MATQTSTDKIDIPRRATQRVRLDLDTLKAAKLKQLAKAKGRTQAEIVERLIDSLE